MNGRHFFSGCNPPARRAGGRARPRRVRAHLGHQDSVQRFHDLGVDVFRGEATFLDRRTIGVASAVLEFRKGVIARGVRAPPIPQSTASQRPAT